MRALVLAFLVAGCTAAEEAPFVLVPPPAAPETPCTNHACGEGCGAGFCNGFGECVDAFPNECPVAQSGRDDPPGTGQIFVVNAIAIPGRTKGFDLDGRCDSGGECVDNSIWVIGQIGNDQIRQGLLGGESLMVIEIARDGDSPLATVKVYAALDADDPFFPANNFKVPPGHTECCEFKLHASSLEGTPLQARARLSVRIDGDRLRSTTTGSIPYSPNPFPYFLSFGAMERAMITAQIGPDGLRDVLIGGVLTIGDLARRLNDIGGNCTGIPALCKTSSLEVYLGVGLTPDIDLDGDGLEQLLDQDGDGHLDRCLDGCIGACDTPQVVAPLDPADPSTCAQDPRIADGFSVSYTLSAIPASIVGVSQ